VKAALVVALLPAIAAAAPKRVHLRASYVDGKGGAHQLELWRDGDRLRRDTDAKLSLFVAHDPGGEDRYRVVDRSRGILYDVARTNLFRLGSFVDWDSLTTLQGPAARRARLRPTGEPDGTTPAGRCRWVGDAERRICLSSRWGMPLMLAEKHGDQWNTVLTVEELHTGTVARTLLEPPKDLQHIDVDRDVAPQD
jgi:hypothetical protein